MTIRFNPKYDVYFSCGYIYNQLANFRTPDRYSIGIELDSKDAYSYNNRGYAYSQVGQYQKAIDDYSKGWSDSKYAEAYFNRAYMYNINKNTIKPSCFFQAGNCMWNKRNKQSPALY